MKKKTHPFGASKQHTDAGVMPPRKRAVIEEAPPEVEAIEEPAGEVVYSDMTRADLYNLARDLELSVTSRSIKDDLIAALEQHATGAD